VLLLDDVRETFAMALRSIGISGNTTVPADIEKGYRKLAALMPNVRKFDSESPKDAFLQGDVSIGVLWNGEAFLAQQENPKIVLVYPKEGAILWIDSLAIPKNAQARRQRARAGELSCCHRTLPSATAKKSATARRTSPP
jgi:spermidine/putrescine transport system substrate-binding protein